MLESLDSQDHQDRPAMRDRTDHPDNPVSQASPARTDSVARERQDQRDSQERLGPPESQERQGSREEPVRTPFQLPLNGGALRSGATLHVQWSSSTSLVDQLLEQNVNVSTLGTQGPAGPLGAPGNAGQPGPNGKPGTSGSVGLPGTDAAYCPCPPRSAVFVNRRVA